MDYIKYLFNVILQAGFCLYKLPDGDEEGCVDSGEYKISQGIPPNSAVNVLIRVYVVAVSFHLILSETRIYYTIHLLCKLMYFSVSTFLYKPPSKLFSFTYNTYSNKDFLITVDSLHYLRINACNVSTALVGEFSV